MNFVTKKTVFLCLAAAWMAVGSSVESVRAQTNPPVREQTNPDELVTLGAETSFSQATQILGSFSRRFAGKTLLDRSGKTGTIGFGIPFMHWRQALDYIANAHNLAVVEYTDSIELVNKPPQPETSNPPVAIPQPEQPPSAVVSQLASMDTREVEISAIFFEGNRRLLREIGIDWSAMYDGRVRVTNFAAGNVSLDAFRVEVPAQSVGLWDVGALLNALEASNYGEILSSPKVKVMDGKKGDIQVGQDFSIKQRDFAGNVTDAFYSTGTILTVTPNVIMDEDTSFIFLDIRAERSTATPDPVSTIINKQEALTQVLLYSGESTVIAGLYETEEINVRRGIPFLKDLPPWFFGLRYLFGYNSRDYREKELIILIKAELVPSLRQRFYQKRSTSTEVINQGRENLKKIDPRRNN